jgi:hypothetical protein
MTSPGDPERKKGMALRPRLQKRCSGFSQGQGMIIESGHGCSFQDDIYSIRRTWFYFKGFGRPFPGSNGKFCQGFWWSKPLKIKPLQALGGILLEMSSFQEQV